MIHMLSLKTATACMHTDWHTKQETMSLVTKVAEIRSRGRRICYWTAMIASTWATIKLHCANYSFYWALVHVIWIQTFAVSLQATFQMFQNFGGDWVEWIIKSVCSYFLPGKGYRGGTNLFWRGCYYWYMPHSGCMRSWASTVYQLVVDNIPEYQLILGYLSIDWLNKWTVITF